MKKTVIVTCCLVAMALSSYAQRRPYGSNRFGKENISGFVALGGQNLLSDLAPNEYAGYNITGVRPDFAVALKAGGEVQLTSDLSLQLGYYLGRVKADEGRSFANLEKSESWRKARALKASGAYHSVTLAVKWRMLERIVPENGFLLQPYVSAGVGAAFLAPKVSNTESAAAFARAGGVTQYYDRDIAHPEYSKTALVFPVAIGLEYEAAPTVSIFAEAGRHFVQSDYVEGIANWNEGAKNDGLVNYMIGVHFSFAKRGFLPCYH